MTWPEVIAYASTTGSCAIFALVWPFHRSDLIKHHVTPKGFPWKGRVRAYATRSCAISDQTSTIGLTLENMGARMRDRKFPGVLSMTSGSYSFIIVYELALSLVICPFPAILFSWGAPSIITQPFFRVFSDMSEVLCSTPMVFSITSAFSLWYFY